MPNPVFSDVHIQAALTQVSVAFIQDESHYIADRVFPIVPVVHQADKYFIWNKGDFFRDQAQMRADATESAGGGFNLTTQAYSANVWAIHKDVGDQTRRNADPAVDIDVATTKWCMEQLLIRRDVLFASNFMAAVWGTNVTGAAAGNGSTTFTFWNDDANGDPFSDISLAQTTILQNTGYEPNVLVMSWPVYQALRKHPLVIDRIKYTQPAFGGNVTPELLAQAFDIEEVLVSKAVYNTAAEGAADSMSFIVGKHALLCYRAPAAGLWQPSAGYVWSWSGFTDMTVVSSALGYFWGSIVQ